ncbi:MAG: peroxiredoxin-like family protein [Bacteroidota bacterium]
MPRLPLALLVALMAVSGSAVSGCADAALDADSDTALEPAPEAVTPTPAAPDAETAASTALQVGAEAPDFALPGASGETVRLGDALAQGPVVLTFYRGAWCPYCNTSLRQFQEALSDIEAAGATLVAISPNTPEGALEMEQAQTLTFPVLSDVGNAVSRDFGLVFEVDEDVRDRYRASGVDLAEANGVDAWELPVPATYVIDTDGTIRFAFVEADYTLRASPRDVIEALQSLS